MTGARGKGAVKNTTTSLKPADDRKVGKRKATVDGSTVRKAKKERKANKDPNKPKRPPSAFFVFLAEFRTTFKKENPDVKAVSAVGRAAGEKWKSMSEEDKAPYEAKAQKRKGDYEKQMKDYHKKQGTSANGVADDEDAEEANDEENEATGEDDDVDDDDED
ncbi:high mobility group B protein 1-like [Hibiscus syriacus]|nr:high mobility group B protein 1-like [Hibiscus syriacus]XP_039007818.1 high mobility group B protein 1-like [Hibiscus syriacus]